MMLLVNQENKQFRVCRSQSCRYELELSTEQQLTETQRWEDELP